MKTQWRKLCWWAGLAAFLGQAAPAATAEITLSPYYSDGLVLQRGEINVIRGESTTDEPIYLRVGDTRARKAAREGKRWEFPIRKSDFKEEETVDLEIFEGEPKNRSADKRLRQIRWGEVWVLEIEEAVATFETLNADFAREVGELRQFDLRGPETPVWQTMQPGADEIPVFVFNFLKMRRAGPTRAAGPVALVRVPPGTFSATAGGANRNAAAVRFAREIELLATQAREIANKDLRSRRRAREIELIRLKHEGKVTPLNLPPDYGLAALWHRSEFPPTLPEAALGAIRIQPLEEISR